MKLLSVNKRPKEWMLDLESIWTEMNKVKITGKSELTEVNLSIHILSNLPEEYEVAVSKLKEKKLKDTRNPLNMEDVRIRLDRRYDRIIKHAELREEETALAACRKQFKGTCRKCGEYGHTSANCMKSKTGQDKGGNSEGKFPGTCHYCKRIRVTR